LLSLVIKSVQFGVLDELQQLKSDDLKQHSDCKILPVLASEEQAGLSTDQT